MFRERYPSYDEMTETLRAWAAAHPSFVRLGSLGQTPEGRELWLLTIGPEPDRIRPALWVDGNMHASELAGSCVALAVADDLVRAHASGAAIVDLPEHVAAILRDDILVYVMPRMCPDGAEVILRTGAYVRSNPRDGRLGRSAPFWRPGDVDGDGRAGLMRRRDPAGSFVESREIPGLMLPRRVEDEGPFYALYPEGTIESWDGFTVPADHYLAGSETDMNRNFPYSWAPEPQQVGAGAYPTSEPESRAVSAFASSHPNIFAWVNLHCYGGCYIRPAGDKTDRKMDQRDLVLYMMIGRWTEELTGYPMVSGYEEFTYEPEKPLHGELSSFAYAQRGAVSMVVELWDLWKQVGLPVQRPFVLNYLTCSREDVEAIARWDRDHNQGRVIGAWKPFSHPQLGEVEVGGYDPRYGIWNPPPERLAEVTANHAKVIFRIAALAPRVRLTELGATTLGGGLTRVSAVVVNEGYLPTYVLSSAKPLVWNDPLRARLVPGEGVEIASGEREHLVGHLEGWGGHEYSAAPSFPRTEASPVRQRVSWVVRGRGRVTVRASAARVGEVEASIEIG
jgi:hypothetical protein